MYQIRNIRWDLPPLCKILLDSPLFCGNVRALRGPVRTKQNDILISQGVFMRTIMLSLLAATALTSAAAMAQPFGQPSTPLSASEKAEIKAEGAKARAAAAERARKAREAREAKAAKAAAEAQHKEEKTPDAMLPDTKPAPEASSTPLGAVPVDAPISGTVPGTTTPLETAPAAVPTAPIGGTPAPASPTVPAPVSANPITPSLPPAAPIPALPPEAPKN